MTWAAGVVLENGFEPVVSGRGPIDADAIERYRTMAVMPFEDAMDMPGTRSRIAGMVTTLSAGPWAERRRTGAVGQRVTETSDSGDPRW
ncbi:MAG: hypothetical protein NNA18_06330 [Nitrospira sp.]|nr:hypothetical protein [Nitrospira sp.]